jgi:hypothetical protein
VFTGAYGNKQAMAVDFFGLTSYALFINQRCVPAGVKLKLSLPFCYGDALAYLHFAVFFGDVYAQCFHLFGEPVEGKRRG